MARPTTREEFKAYCLRRLGDGVIDINVSDAQVDDRIDDAVSYWWDYHADGTEEIFLKHQITQTDIDNGYIPVPDNIIGAVDLLDIGSAVYTSDTWTANNSFNVWLEDMQYINDFSLSSYYMTLQRIQEIQKMFSTNPTYRYNRHLNKLHIDTDWGLNLELGNWIVVRAFQILPDDDSVADLWKDIWLSEYTTALIKYQWGSNLSKFEGLQLPGGVTFNGQTIKDEAREDIERMKGEMLDNYAMPLPMLIG